jgi:hypothetical protein
MSELESKTEVEAEAQDFTDELADEALDRSQQFTACLCLPGFCAPKCR